MLGNVILGGAHTFAHAEHQSSRDRQKPSHHGACPFIHRSEASRFTRAASQSLRIQHSRTNEFARTPPLERCTDLIVMVQSLHCTSFRAAGIGAECSLPNDGSTSKCPVCGGLLDHGTAIAHEPVGAVKPLPNALFMTAVLSSSRPNVRPGLVPKQAAQRSFVVNLEHGLHARPCAILVKTLQPYRSGVLVELNGETASGKSILGLMALAAGPGSTISFTIQGEDAFEAIAQVERLFATNFDASQASASSTHHS